MHQDTIHNIIKRIWSTIDKAEDIFWISSGGPKDIWISASAADLSDHLLGGLLQLIRYTKCVLHLQAKQETRVVQAVKGSR